MPKAKKRGKGGRGDKEKPLLTVQGVLRLEKSFIAPQHEGAPTMVVKKSDDAEPEVVKFVPGQSEHDLVSYKAGYDVGPSNPFPTNEPEMELFEQKAKVDAVEAAFEDMKRQSEQERQEREKKFQVHEPLNPSASASTSTSSEPQPVPPPPKELLNPDDPTSYFLPDHLSQEPGFHNDKPLEFGEKRSQVATHAHLPELPPGDEEAALSSAGKVFQIASQGEVPDKDVMPPPASKSSESPAEIDLMDTSEYEGGEREQNTPATELLPKFKPLPSADDAPADGDSAERAAPADKDKSEPVGEMALNVAIEMEEKRKREARERIEKGVEEEGDHQIFSLDEITAMKSGDPAQQQHGPDLSGQALQELLQQQADNSAKQILDSYWQFVRENPQDFNGWCYLIQHVENTDLLDEVRSVYNAFLPLYPYCFAYWQRYSELERKHENWQRALAILHRGLEAIPLSVDLWTSYLQLYHKMYEAHEQFDDLYRTQCERAIMTVGLEYRSDLLWEHYIDSELERNNLKWVTNLFRRLVGIPTSLYNKHWDNFIAHIRDHHPRDILDYEEYEQLRKVTCKELDLKYRPDPVTESSKPREVVQPEDKLKAGMKERIVASVVSDHEKCEEEVDKRFKFEEKIKRNYFHVKPVDLKQLKNWEAYLDFEIEQGNHERIVVLFERCLIPCAHYEHFWAKYARYLERYHKHRESTPLKPGEKAKVEESPLKKARWAFGTGLTNVDEIREKRCTWTLRGWKQKDKDGKEVMMAEEEPVKEPQTKDGKSEEEGNKSDEGSSEKENEAEDKDKENEAEAKDNDQAAKSGDNEQLAQDVIDGEMSMVLKTSWEGKGREAVRDVFKRACIVHCPKKAMVKLRWAAFEEESGEVERAKNILTELNKQFPLLLECCIQLIDIERRAGNLKEADKLYERLMAKIPQNRKNIKAWLRLKRARFQFKVCRDPDKALATLQQVPKKERGDPRRYAQVIDICYQRQPVDIRGVTAAIELAIKSPKLTNMQKLEFVKRKVEFMQEFGEVTSYRTACDQLKEFRRLCSSELKQEARRKRDLEKQEQKLKELDTAKAQAEAEAAARAEQLAAEGKRVLCTNCQAGMMPDADGVYEFEGAGVSATKKKAEAEEDDDGVVDLLDMVIPDDQEEQIKKTLEEKTKYKEVAPTWELNMETYGYGTKRRKVYDPDYEHVESAKFREYERLEVEGYDPTQKDPEREKPRNINAPGLGSRELPPKQSDEEERKRMAYTSSDYVVQPKVPQLVMGEMPSHMGRGRGRGGQVRQRDEEQESRERDVSVFELPPEIANPQKSPCVNVPDWFVKEGGELCLSDTTSGVSVIRYWPKFLSEKGNNLMFNKLRKYCKWHQKQEKIAGQWKYVSRLVAWYGPCDYSYSGLHLEKNLNWAPELLDLLHRLMAMTRHDFNSCFLNLYRHGHDMCGWHADVHPQLGRNPPVASVSLGAVRVFELRKKTGPPNFIRFPLFPGSLLVMEGATQEDWLHCLPRDVNCQEERVNLTFRTMYSSKRV